jgi:DNA-binding NarL/FixJ family response regulator
MTEYGAERTAGRSLEQQDVSRQHVHAVLPPTRVSIHAEDPIAAAGIASLLDGISTIVVLGSQHKASAQVGVLVSDRFRPDRARLRQAARRAVWPPIVLVADDLPDDDLAALASSVRVAVVMPRWAVSTHRLLNGISTARGGGQALSPGVIRELLGVVQRPGVGTDSNKLVLSAREVEVLKLLAEGLVTDEIARQLALSDRTVKTILWDLMKRFELRNRPHAVAFAYRAGLL